MTTAGATDRDLEFGTVNLSEGPDLHPKFIKERLGHRILLVRSGRGE